MPGNDSTTHSCLARILTVDSYDLSDDAPFPLPAAPLLAVAFDLDGLMFNTEDLYEHVGTEVLRRRGKEFTAELMHQMIGRPSPIAIQLMIDYHELEDTIEQIADESADVFYGLLEEHLQPMPGLLTLLGALDAAALPRGIVTSSGRRFAERVLAIAELAGRFDFIITAEDIVRGKPDPEPYLLAAARFGIDAAQMLVLEDSANGALSGVASGAYTVAVPSGHTSGHAFPGVKFVANSLSDPRIRSILGMRP
jgi:HAD superfamily hydrolase (TIGR01509 family)